MDNQQMDRKEYLEERRLLVSLESEAYKSFDKTLLVLSSGAIALSMTFIDKLHCATFLYLLVISWIFWIVSIFLQLFSFVVSSKAMREELAILNEQYNDYSKDPRQNKYSDNKMSIMSMLNYVSIGAFALGTLLFIVFITINIGCINGITMKSKALDIRNVYDYQGTKKEVNIYMEDESKKSLNKGKEVRKFAEVPLRLEKPLEQSHSESKPPTTSEPTSKK
ncbi:MAG: hypothetical protein ABH886_06925 [Candidatus Desantisbacteria bacterium]